MASALALLAPAFGCSSSDDGASPTSGAPDAGGADSGEAAAPPSIGTVEAFAELPGSSEGLAFAPGPDGETVLYVGSKNRIVRVAPDGTVSDHVALPGPLGMAARADGDLVVCGKVEGDGGEMPGVLWRVTRTGEKSILVGPGAIAFKLTNFVAVAPDDSLVFSDSGAHKLYRANGDGSGVELVTDAISYPNGLTFSADGKTLYVASWNGKKVWALPFGTDGKYGAPEAFSTDLDNVDGLATYANGDLLYIASADGLVRYGLDKTKSTLVPAATFGLPANGAFGAGAYGEGWVYVTNLIGNKLWRAFVGEKGAPLPAR